MTELIVQSFEALCFLEPGTLVEWKKGTKSLGFAIVISPLHSVDQDRPESEKPNKCFHLQQNFCSANTFVEGSFVQFGVVPIVRTVKISRDNFLQLGTFKIVGNKANMLSSFISYGICRLEHMNIIDNK